MLILIFYSDIGCPKQNNRMNLINVKATDNSPEIILDIESNIFSIKGKSVLTEVDDFYAPVFNWLEDAIILKDKSEIFFEKVII